MQNYTCIAGDAYALSLYGNGLLPPAQSQNTPQYLLVKGKITFDEDYTFAAGSDIVFLDNNSGFRVYSRKLTLQGSYLHGCTKLWAGVEVRPSAEVSVEHCTFEDAKAAIILRDLSKIEVTGSAFKKNVFGILGIRGNLLNPNPISILLSSNNGISGNAFWGDDQLLEPIAPAAIDPGFDYNVSASPTNYPYAGIWIERVTALTIGHTSLNPGAPLNTFQDFGQHWEIGINTCGICSIASGLTVQNSAFYNFGYFDPGNDDITSAAIYARNEEATIKQTTVTGLNQQAQVSPPLTFSLCYYDVNTSGTHLTATEISSYKSGRPIKASSVINNLQGPIKCLIKNNKFDYFRAVGIEIILKKQVTINIENNQLFDNDELNDPAQRYGIFIENKDNSEAVLAGSRIYNNQIRSRSILLNGAFWGIALYKISYLTIEQNTIHDNLSPSNLAGFYGIRTQQSPCNGLRILRNSARGAKIDYHDSNSGFYTPSSGIFINESLNCVLNCNSMDNTNFGMLFTKNCNNADVRKNEFNYHGKGLALGDEIIIDPTIFTQIGLQTNKENRWYGTNSPVEAFALNLPSALASMFEVNSSNLNSIFWPLPRKIGSDDDNFVWFKPSTTGTEADENVIACTDTYPGPEFESRLAGTDYALLNGAYQPPLPYPALTWEAKWEFADRLNRNPGLQTISNDVAQYYQNTYNDPYSSLNRAYQAYLNRWRPNHPLTAQVESQAAALSAAIAQRFALDNQLSGNAAENGALNDQMLQGDLAIQNLTAQLEAAVASLNALINQQMEAVIADVDNISCSTPYETDMKDVVKTLLLSHHTGGVLTSEQSARMAEIAGKCRYSGGYAVLLARSFFAPQESYGQDAACGTEERNNQKPHLLSGEIRVCPNPADQLVLLQVENAFSNGVARVFNAQGKLLNAFEFQAPGTRLPVGNLANGIYFLDIRLDGKPGIRKSFVVNH